MSDKKQDKKPEELTSEDLDKAVGAGIMVPEAVPTGGDSIVGTNDNDRVVMHDRTAEERKK